jgi:hypothetical protein
VNHLKPSNSTGFSRCPDIVRWVVDTSVSGGGNG